MQYVLGCFNMFTKKPRHVHSGAEHARHVSHSFAPSGIKLRAFGMIQIAHQSLGARCGLFCAQTVSLDLIGIIRLINRITLKSLTLLESHGQIVVQIDD